jgi:hypothetical protein
MGAKQEMKLLLKGLDEHSISFEELERTVARVESQLGKNHDKEDILPLLHRAEVPRTDANVVASLVLG